MLKPIPYEEGWVGGFSALKVALKIVDKNGSRLKDKHSVKDSSRPPGNGSQSSGKSAKFRLDAKYLVQVHDLMVKSRVLEERLIRMYKQSNGYFWIGGPGEEAFNVPLGLHVKKGQGLDYDFLHFHYRSGAIMTAMGMDPVEPMRQMKNVASDPFSGGRNFVNHFSRRAWNVVPVSSTIETQYATAIGTAIAQKRHGGTGITIVNGGDAGTAEGEFASCLIWSTRPVNELPVLMIVVNNGWGIETPAHTQHGEKRISDRGKAFGMKTMTINGNDVEESIFAIREMMDYVRNERKPALLEAMCSRLYGHSSATGCNFVKSEVDPVLAFEERLEGAGILSRKKMDEIREKYNEELLQLAQKVVEEPMPDPSTIYDHVYCGQKGRYW